MRDLVQLLLQQLECQVAVELWCGSNRTCQANAKNTARHVRQSCVCHGWSDSLGLTQQWSSRFRPQHCQLWLPTEDASVSAVLGVLSALEALCDNALYKLTLLVLVYYL